jgi:hypothetical protein
LFHFLVTYFVVQFTSLCLSFEQIFMFIFFIFKETSIMWCFRSFCHIIDYVTLQLYNNFPVSQTCHIKEVKTKPVHGKEIINNANMSSTFYLFISIAMKSSMIK